jgi:hypothetical protein
MIDTGPLDVGVDAPPTGLLSITKESRSGVSENLTAEGSLDWAHWGRNTVTAFNHRSPGGLILQGTTTGTAALPMLSSKKFVWSDGTPTTSASTSDGLVFTTIGEGQTFQVSASPTSTRTLRVYTGWANKAVGGITATLSDGSAPMAIATGSGGSSFSVDYDRFVIVFRSGTAGATLTVKFAKTASGGAASGSGSVDLFAATLQ